VLTGGKKMQGQFFEPTVISSQRQHAVRHEETLAPSPRCSASRPEQEAIAAANNTIFGLASYFYSRDVGRIFRVSEALEYGMVGINVGSWPRARTVAASAVGPGPRGLQPRHGRLSE